MVSNAIKNFDILAINVMNILLNYFDSQQNYFQICI